VKLGYNPNSSSLSVDVSFLLFGVLVLSLLLPLVALIVRLSRRARAHPPDGPGGGAGAGAGAVGPGAGAGAAAGAAGDGAADGAAGDGPAARGGAAAGGPHARAFRPEAFGGIVHLARPRGLAFIDRAAARRLGHDGGGRWEAPAPAGAPLEDGPLSAPLEAHLVLTRRCPAGCAGCYVDAGPAPAAGELGAAGWRAALDALAAMGVFHVALGGGESALLPDLPALARHARARGLVPNLTTSGRGVAALLPQADLFGQINVSLDGVGAAAYARVRGHDGFALADAAVTALRARTPHVGLNVVLTSATFDDLDRVLAYARLRRVRDVELLRYKPAGRGASAFAALTLTDAQHRALLPTVLRLARRHRVRVRLDCSFVPMLAHDHPDLRLLRALGVAGCAGGDQLVGVRPDGRVAACSFAPPPAGGPQVTELAAYWPRADAFAPFRTLPDAAPCRDCPARALCRGGCRAVAAHLAGTLAAPDPECPRVVAHQAAHRRVIVAGAA
jgi:radical SAM protein with 4Fe4S-binding SPASM domain